MTQGDKPKTDTGERPSPAARQGRAERKPKDRLKDQLRDWAKKVTPYPADEG